MQTATDANDIRYWTWHDTFGVLIPLLVFVLLRLPPLLHQPGGQDEQFFSVPGLTVWREGIPRIPYLPTENRETFFAGADRCLMALPPGLFYCQAPFFGCFPAGYPTSRLPLFVGGMVAIVLSYIFARQLGAKRFGAALTGVLVAVSRPLMFTAIVARPDLLCSLCGMIVTLMALSNTAMSSRRLVGMGLLNGLGILFHPFALIYCLQSACAVFALPAKLATRFARVLGLASVSALTASLWGLLIYYYPDEFRSQFFSNVLDRAGPGLPSRLIWPIPYLQHHSVLLYEFAGSWQCGMMAVGVILGGWQLLTSHRSAIRIILWVVSSYYLTAAVAGQHPTKGYWVYPAMLSIGLLCFGLERLTERYITTDHRAGWSTVGHAAWALALMTAMIPGAGLTSTALYLRHWNEPAYHGQKFIAQVLEEMPDEGVVLADLCYVFDVYLSGRPTLLAQDKIKYWGEGKLDYTYLLLSWEGRDNRWNIDYQAQFIKSFGDAAIKQKCFVDLYGGRSTVHQGNDAIK